MSARIFSNVRVDGQLEPETTFIAYRQGEQFGVVLTMRSQTGDNLPLDIAGWSFSARAAYYRYDLSISDTSVNLTKPRRPSTIVEPADKVLTATAASDTTTGRVIILIPDDLYPGEAPFDTNSNVPVARVEVRITENDDRTNPTIHKQNLAIIIRNGLDHD